MLKRAVPSKGNGEKQVVENVGVMLDERAGIEMATGGSQDNGDK
jgi:hypothetical protein